jgi:hypothetical protein
VKALKHSRPSARSASPSKTEVVKRARAEKVRRHHRTFDLAQWVGPLPAETLAAYSALAPTGVPLPAGSVNRNFPEVDPLMNG